MSGGSTGGRTPGCGDACLAIDSFSVGVAGVADAAGLMGVSDAAGLMGAAGVVGAASTVGALCVTAFGVMVTAVGRVVNGALAITG